MKRAAPPASPPRGAVPATSRRRRRCDEPVLATLVDKEVRALFVSPIAYAVIAVFLVLSGYTFTVTLFVTKQATLVHIFFQAAVQLVLLVPLITMRQFAEERRSGTLELLLTAPVREIDIVLAKFVACMACCSAMIAPHARLRRRARRSTATRTGGRSTAAISASSCSPRALVSIGLAVSALTANQIVAAVVSLGLFGLLWTIDTLASLLPHALRELAARPVAAGALHALRGRRDVRLGFRLLPHRDPARPVPRRARAGAALSHGRACRRARLRCCWFGGWLVAVARAVRGRAAAAAADGLGAIGERALCGGVRRRRASASRVLANVALRLHDAHIDLTREKIYTPSATAMTVVDELRTPVARHLLLPLPGPRRAARARHPARSWRRRNPLLTVVTRRSRQAAALARREGIRLYNAAVVEADGRRVLIQGTDEAEIAIGIQRVLRERVDHRLLPRRPRRVADGQLRVPHAPRRRRRPQPRRRVVAASSRLPGHGVGRLRRALEAQGYDARKLVLATAGAVPDRLHAARRGQSAHHVPAGGKRGAARLSRAAAARLAAVRPRLRARSRASRGCCPTSASGSSRRWSSIR